MHVPPAGARAGGAQTPSNTAQPVDHVGLVPRASHSGKSEVSLQDQNHITCSRVSETSLCKPAPRESFRCDFEREWERFARCWPRLAEPRAVFDQGPQGTMPLANRAGGCAEGNCTPECQQQQATSKGTRKEFKRDARALLRFRYGITSRRCFEAVLCFRHGISALAPSLRPSTACACSLTQWRTGSATRTRTATCAIS